MCIRDRANCVYLGRRSLSVYESAIRSERKWMYFCTCDSTNFASTKGIYRFVCGRHFGLFRFLETSFVSFGKISDDHHKIRSNTKPQEVFLSFFNSIIPTYRLFTLSQKKTNCYPFTHHAWKMSPHYLLQEALLLQRNRATRYVSWNIMAVFWLSYWQEALLIHRNRASTLSVEIV